jgi:Flp pilus assembly protein TadD
MLRAGPWFAVVLVLFLCSSEISHHAAIPEPSLASVAPSAEENALIAEGTALHDRGQLAEARTKFEKALVINPHNPQAFYELAVTQSAQRDCKSAIGTAMKGASYWSPLRGALYMVIGNCLDEAGRKDEALEYLEEAGKLMPDDFMVQYNLALSLRNSGKAGKAVECLKRGIAANPGHASSHMLLGSIWLDRGLRVPALLAFSRFLMIEHEGPRAKMVAPALLQILRSWSRAEGKEGEKNRTIYVEAKDARPEEGDFSQVVMSLSLWQGISQAVPKEKRPPELETNVLSLSAAFRALDASEITSQDAFACRMYARYFAEAASKNFQETLARYILKECGLPGASSWPSRADDKAKVKSLQEWSEEYPWHKPEDPGADYGPKPAPSGRSEAPEEKIESGPAP